MSTSKNKTKSQTTNTYGYQPGAQSADIDALRGMKATVDPSIPYFFAQRRKDLEGSYNNPYGASTTPAVRDNAMRAASRGLDQAQGQAMSEAQYNADNSNFQRQGVIAGMTAPQLVQTGGSSTGTQTSGPTPLGLGLQVAQGAIGAFA